MEVGEHQCEYVMSGVVNPASHKGLGSLSSLLIFFVEVLTITGASWPQTASTDFSCVYLFALIPCVCWGVSMNARGGWWVLWI